jgi:ferredoxin
MRVLVKSIGHTLFTNRELNIQKIFDNELFLVLMFQLLIGVEDEDSCGRSGQCETCPVTGLRGKCHKSTRPRRQRTLSWPIRLMPKPLSKALPLFFPQERSDEEAHGSPAESEVFHGNQRR